MSEDERDVKGDEEEDLGEFDFADPLKREGDDELPGLDPIVIVPPES